MSTSTGDKEAIARALRIQQHTPTPWTWSIGADGRQALMSTDGTVICTADFPGQRADEYGNIVFPVGSVAGKNMAFIVAACNAHEALVEVLKRAYGELAQPTTASAHIATGLAIEAALALATNTEGTD